MNAVVESFVSPHSLEAEMCVLGSMMLSPAVIEPVMEAITENDFYRPGHKTIFQSITNLAMNGRAVDLVTVRQDLLERGQLQFAGGVEYLIQIAESVPTPANAVDYAEIVLDKSMLRNLESAGYEIVKQVHDGEDTTDEKLESAERTVFEVGKRRLRKSFVELRTAAHDFMEDVDKLYESGVPILGAPSGFYDLDSITGGLYETDLLILAARPAMGKTAFAMSIATHVAAQKKGAVAVFSLEMGAKQLVRRMVAGRSQMSMSILKKPNLSGDDYDRLVDACEQLYSLPIFIDDNSDITPFELRAKVRRLKAEHGLSLVVIDYLQLMRSNRRTENRVQEVGEIARALKGLAKEMNVPVIALSQLSRQVENRPDKRPMLSDIRESGSIEAEADLVMFIYRDAYYKAKEEGADQPQDLPPSHVEAAEIIIAKHRNGPTGKVEVGFQPAYARFVNLKR